MPVKISAVVCDDIRQESTGKLFLIGTYIQNMTVPELPMDSRFDCLIRFQGLPDHAEVMELTIRHVGRKPEVSSYKFPPIIEGATTVVIFGMPIIATRAGRVSLEVAVDGGRRRKIESIDIEASPSAD